MTAEPTVALIHGMGSSRRAWDLVLPLLATAGVRAVTIELPGYGKQRRTAPARTVEAMADAVAPVIAALGERTAVVGHSLGGLVATALAERRPAWLARIGLINSSLTAESRLTAHSGSEGLIRRPLIGRLAWRIAPRDSLRSGLCSAFAPGFAVPDVFVDDLRACSWSTFTRSSDAVYAYLRAGDLTARLGALQVPATLIYGTRDLRIDPLSIAAIRKARPHSLIEIAGSGHTPMWETPAAAAGAVSAVALGELDAAGAWPA